jgi:hypothetical protein
MKTSIKLLIQIGALGVLTASATARSACVVPPNTLTAIGATSVLDASGQGNFSCANMSPGPDGQPMLDVTADVTLTPALTDQSGRWLSVDISAPASKEIDAVYIRANGNGARCLYTFSNYSLTASGVESGGDDFDAADVIVCADGSGTPPPEEPVIIEPVSTVGDGCVGEVTVVIDGIEQSLDDLALVTAVSLDGDTLAVCNGAGEMSEQVQCVNLCENFTPRAETPECAAASTGLTNGELDLEACRPCDLSDPIQPPGTDKDGNPLFFCWEYTNSVVRDDLPLGTYPSMPGTQFVPGTMIPRTLGTLLPHKEAWSTSDETKVFNGCYTTTRTLNGRLYTYTTCK